MARPKSSDPRAPVSLRLPASVLSAIDERRAADQSRAAWIEATVEAALSDDTQAASSAERSSGHRTRVKASATGPVPARGASRPVASPRPAAFNVGPRVHHARCACPICKPPPKSKPPKH